MQILTSRKELKLLALYGLIMASFVFCLKWLQWKYLIADHSVEIYVGAVALLFTILGIWIAHKIIRPKTVEVIIEKQVPVPLAETPAFDEAAWKRLNLTARENEVLQLLVKGYTNAEIAAQLYLSVSTIKTHVSNLFVKLDVTSRVKAIVVRNALLFCQRKEHNSTDMKTSTNNTQSFTTKPRNNFLFTSIFQL